MGFSRRRRGKDGKPRYTAYYRDLRGREVSAGTFARKADADAAWQAAEVNARAGLRHDRAGTADVRPLCRGGVAAQPPDGAVHPGGLHAGDLPAHSAARSCP